MFYKNNISIFCLFVCLILRGGNGTAQGILPVKEFKKDSLEKVQFAPFFNKSIPEKYAIPIKTALQYYPSLRDARIIFRVKKTRTPLAAMPTIGSVFKRKSKRTYIVTISSESTTFLNKIILDSLNFNAQIGVLGHEISHIMEFHSKSGLFLIGLAFRHLSQKEMDKFEYNTDKRCIEQGLGYQLLAWSKNTREALQVEHFNRENSDKMMQRERYMNPNTIERFMKTMSIYE